MRDLTPFEALAGTYGACAFDHLNCQNTREFHQNFGKKVKCPGGGGGLPGVGCVMGSFRIDWFIKLAKLQILKKLTFPFGKS